MLFFLTFELFIIILCSPFPATTYILIAKWWFIFLFLQHPCDYESSDSSAVAEWLPVFYTQWDLHAISSYLFTINAHLLSFLTECSHFRFSWYVLLGIQKKMHCVLVPSYSPRSSAFLLRLLHFDIFRISGRVRKAASA